MTWSLDVDILLYAADLSNPRHAEAEEILRAAARSSELLCLTWPTLMGFVRIVTHPSIFDTPLSPAEAVRNVTGLLALPNVRVLVETERFWSVYQEVTGDQVVRGNLVPDAHLAALLKTHGVRRLVTADVDFRRLPFLEVVNPYLWPGCEPRQPALGRALLRHP